MRGAEGRGEIQNDWPVAFVVVVFVSSLRAFRKGACPRETTLMGGMALHLSQGPT
eukprot:m.57031 g.57031  ORF g.57031 m.57031 type:complete len:55 (+) comp12080_c1_seq1:579-743(+)